ncbi:MAG TPA: YdjY domain-containing protein [Opitutales bacterium]|nr:YdjY domain-containing protein [Opitutales bacterium]
MTHLQRRPRCIALCCYILAAIAAPLAAEETKIKAAEPSDNIIKLPGIEIHPEKRIVDVDAQVTLTDGLLELIACTEGTKEHEAVIRINALPMHMHTALLLIGARNGTPAMRKPINEEQTRWMHVRPSGDPIKVSLVVTNEEGEEVERPINDFIRRTEGDPYMPDYGFEEDNEAGSESKEAFPNVFVFTGSHLIEDKNGNKQYLADSSGHVITISTFGDETLGLPDIQSRENGELVWEVDATHLPPLDTKVKLRLRPKI